MKKLFKNGRILNVFTAELQKTNLLVKDDIIIGIGDYLDDDADRIIDVRGKVIVPGFIDGHIHVESSMCTPYELSKLCLVHGTTSIVSDPHEIANVLGVPGVLYMLEASEGLPFNIFYTLPSCVPASPLDESGATLLAKDLVSLYKHDRIIALGEMMNFPGVIYEDSQVLDKINDAFKHGRVVDGHSPALSGKDLDRYIAKGIDSEHECSTIDEALEKMRKGQWIMIREGTAAKNLNALLPLFEEPYCHRAMLVCDDLNPSELLKEGHLDRIIKKAIKAKKSIITAIQMVTIRPAERFHLKNLGAIAPGYKADLVILNDLESLDIRDVYKDGKIVVRNKKVLDYPKPVVDPKLEELVRTSFNVKVLEKEDFYIEEKGDRCRVIEIVPGEIITNEVIYKMNWENNGIDLNRDILKIAVIERHHNTGHIGLGFINGLGLKSGAIASSVSHDSHNIIVVGTNEEDMAVAANHIRLNGGDVVVSNKEILAELPLQIAGLMSELSGEQVATRNEAIQEAVSSLGVLEMIEPFMNMAFVSLPVIPFLKLTTQGLVDVQTQKRVSLYIED